MKQNLMDKYLAIKDWEQQYLLPTLEKLNAEIKKISTKTSVIQE